MSEEWQKYIGKNIEQEMSEEEQKDVLEEIEKRITKMLIRIIVENREILPEEKAVYSEFMQTYLKKCIEINYDTIQMSVLLKIIVGLVSPEQDFNTIDISSQSDTYAFFIVEYFKHKPGKLYVDKLSGIVNKLKSDDITNEEYQRYDYIIRNLNYAYDFSDIEGIMFPLIEKGEKLGLKSIALNAAIEMYIAKNTFKERTGFTISNTNKEITEIILQYYKKQLQRSARDINNNGAVMHLIKEARLKKLPLDDSEKIMSILEERNASKEMPNMDNYNLKIQNGEDLSEEELELFLEDVSEIRLQVGKIPQMYSDYLIKQVILSKINDEQYKNEILRALEDFGEKELENSGVENVNISFVQPEITGYFNSAGAFVEKVNKIMLSKTIFDDIGMLKKLELILHECTHAKIAHDIENGKLDNKKILILKEKIIREIEPQYYEENYKYMFEEIEARKQAYIKRKQVLERLGFSEKEIFSMDAEDVNGKILEAEEDEKKGYNKVLNGKQGIDAIFSYILQENPQILDKYPIFNNEKESQR